MSSNPWYTHSLACNCIYCRAPHIQLQLSASNVPNTASCGYQRISNFAPNLDPIEPLPGDIEHMKQVEPIIDEPVAQIGWKPVNPVIRLIRRLRGKEAGE